jgi:hypothetical protein
VSLKTHFRTANFSFSWTPSISSTVFSLVVTKKGVLCGIKKVPHCFYVF